MNLRLQKKRLSKVVKIAGARYTPGLNIETPLSYTFDALGRTPRFYTRLTRHLEEIHKNSKYISSTEAYKISKTE
jgi:hypothetical protein